MTETATTPVQEEQGTPVFSYSPDRRTALVLCGTGAQIAPVASVDHRPLGDGGVGPFSRKMQEVYFDVVRGKVDKYKEWCTPVY